MVEDLIPAPKISFYGNQPLSAVPVHLSLTGKLSEKALLSLICKQTYKQL